MSRPIHFEIQADDLDRAKAFYADVFGWSFEDYSQVTGSPYWGVVTGPEDSPGSTAACSSGPRPPPARVRAPTRPCSRWGSRTSTRRPRRSRPPAAGSRSPRRRCTGMAWQGYFLDTEGNTFGIHQPDENAA